MPWVLLQKASKCRKNLCFQNFEQERSGAFLIFFCCARRKSMPFAILLAHAQSEEQQQWVWKLSFLLINLTWFNNRTQHSSHESITPSNSSIYQSCTVPCLSVYFHARLPAADFSRSISRTIKIGAWRVAGHKKCPRKLQEGLEPEANAHPMLSKCFRLRVAELLSRTVCSLFTGENSWSSNTITIEDCSGLFRLEYTDKGN